MFLSRTFASACYQPISPYLALTTAADCVLLVLTHFLVNIFIGWRIKLVVKNELILTGQGLLPSVKLNTNKWADSKPEQMFLPYRNSY